MCIRDRAHAAFDRRLADVGVRGVVRDQVADGVGHFEQFEDCLLYTSDAADERSSVDLGGRRIIKKKNTRYM